MTHEPRTTEEIYGSLQDSLTGKIEKLKNFTERSFNYIFAVAVSREVRTLEIRATVSELAGWVDYSGGPVTDEDLNQLGLDNDVSAAEVNQYMEDDYLDQFVKIVGVDRLPGSRATGTVTFTTQASYTEIPEGTIVSTSPDSNGDTIEFATTQDAETLDGVSVVSDVPIQAEEIGPTHNLAADTIIRLADPPIGVKGVTNPESTTGGTEEETNQELRERAKQAVQSSSLGGTTDGIKGYLRQEIEGVGQGDVVLDEFTDEKPPTVDVIVDGGLDGEVTDGIEFARPTGIQHNLIRPEVVQLGVNSELIGTDIDTARVTDNVNNFLLNAGIGQNFYSDELIREIMSTDSNIVNIDNLGSVIERVTNETFIYQSDTTDYRLDYTYEDVNGSITVEDAAGTQYTEGTDFSVDDQTGDGWAETLVWTGSTPSDGSKVFVDYDVTVVGQTADSDEYETTLVRDEIFTWNESASDTFSFDVNDDLYQLTYVPFAGTTSITDASGDTYTEGTDYQMIDDTGDGYAQTVDWSLEGATPDGGENFTVSYNQKLYETKYEHRDTPGGIIRDSSGDVYNQDTEYTTADYDLDGEKDSIEWLTNPSSISDGEEFYFTYYSEGDLVLADREKIDPGTISMQGN